MKVMGPPSLIPSDRRQTFVSNEPDKENCAPVNRRETFQPSDLENRFRNQTRRQTFVKLPQPDSWTPQKIVEPTMERKRWPEAPVHIGNLSGLERLDETSEDSVFTEITKTEESKLDCSIELKNYCLSPAKSFATTGQPRDRSILGELSVHNLSAATIPRIILNKDPEPLNLSLKNRTEIYQPDVSDISLAEYSLNMSGKDEAEGQEVPEDAAEGIEVHEFAAGDLDVAQGGAGSLDVYESAADQSVSLNMSENEAGMSMAVNMSEYRPERIADLEGELAEAEDRELEEEIDRLAIARAASGCR